MSVGFYHDELEPVAGRVLAGGGRVILSALPREHQMVVYHHGVDPVCQDKFSPGRFRLRVEGLSGGGENESKQNNECAEQFHDPFLLKVSERGQPFWSLEFGASLAEARPARDNARVMRLSGWLGLIYFLSELLLTVTRRSQSQTGTKQDRSTLRVLWMVIIVSIGASLFVAGNWRAGALPYGREFAIAGVVLFAAGLIFRWWAIVTLGRFFTVDVTIEKDHELVERGPFRWVRHPSYTGVLLAFVGWALTLRNWGAIVVVLVPIFIAFVRRMNVEEEALSRALGEKYAAYLRRTKRLVPGVY